MKPDHEKAPQEKTSAHEGHGLSSSLLGRLRIRATRGPKTPTAFEARIRWVKITLNIVIILSLALLIGTMFAPIEEIYNADGVVRPAHYRSIYATTAVEQLERPLVSEGDTVRRGEVLMRFRLPEMEYEVAKMAGDLAGFEADLTVQQAKTASLEKLPLPKEFWEIQEQLTKSLANVDYYAVQLERAKQLAQSGDISAQELDKATLDYEQQKIEADRLKQRADLIEAGYAETLLAQAHAEETRIRKRIEATAARLEQLRMELQRHSAVKAPADGMILDLPYKNVIGTIQAGEELVYMAIGDEKIILMFGMQKNFDKVLPGQPVRYKSQVYDAYKFDRAEGKVLQISQIRQKDRTGSTQGDTQERYYSILASIERQPKELMLDSNVTASIILRRDRLYRIFFGME